MNVTTGAIGQIVADNSLQYCIIQNIGASPTSFVESNSEKWEEYHELPVFENWIEKRFTHL
jgi:hypothetical protein